MQTTTWLLRFIRRTGFAMCGTGFALAQSTSFNLDVGIGPTPTSSYGAAAGQAGLWVPIAPATPNVAIPLTNVLGAPTTATLSYTSGFDFAFDNPLTQGDDQALLDDSQGIFANSHWSFANLRPGDYEVWSYAWAPDSPLYFRTRVVVTGSPDPAQVVGGSLWNGQFVQGGHYAKHNVTVDASGALEIVFSLAVSACTVNGVQLRELGWNDLGLGKPGVSGTPLLTGSGLVAPGSANTLALTLANPNASAWLVIGFYANNTPFLGGVLVPEPILLSVATTDAGGSVLTPLGIPTFLPSGLAILFQQWIQDPTATFGFSASNGLRGVIQ